MCGPAAIPIALMVAGTVASKMGEAKAGKAARDASREDTEARRNLRTTEYGRQDDLQAQAAQLFQRQLSTQGADPQKAKIAEAAASREAAYNEQTAARADDYIPGDPSAPKVIKDQVGLKLSDALNRAKEAGSKKAFLEAFGDVNVQNQISGNQAAQGITGFNQLRQSSGRVYGSELDARDMILQSELAKAKNKGSGLRTVGSMLTAAGQMGSMFMGGGGMAGLAGLFGGAGAGSMGSLAGSSFVPGGGGSYHPAL